MKRRLHSLLYSPINLDGQILGDPTIQQLGDKLSIALGNNEIFLSVGNHIVEISYLLTNAIYKTEEGSSRFVEKF